MKYLIFAFSFLFSINSVADYKVYASQNQKINIPEKSGPWEAPSGEPALHPNGVTVTCLDMPDGAEFDLNGKTYKVVYNKTDAATYASVACTSNVTDLSESFRNDVNFNENIAHWDTSNVTTMYFMFGSANSFNQSLKYWDTSSLENMDYTFLRANAFNGNIDEWNVSNVTSMRATFAYAPLFNRDISKWDTSNVTNMTETFMSAINFNQDVGDWDTSNVLTMTKMFSEAREFNQDLSRWCVGNIEEQPYNFHSFSSPVYSSSWILPKPNWNTCPQ